MSKPISQLDDVVNISQFIVPGIEGTGPYTNSKGKLVTFFMPKSGGNFTGAVTVGGTPVVTDAPSDGKVYSRLNAAWTESLAKSTIDAANLVQDNRLTAVETKNTTQDGRLTAIETVNTNQDTAIAGKVGEAPNDGKQYARKSLAWAEVTQPPPATYIGDAPPPSPVPGQLWWESDTGSTWIYYNDGNTTQWVQISAIGTTTPLSDAPTDGKAYGRKNAAWNEVLPIAGGVLTGNLTVRKTGGVGVIIDASDGGQNAELILANQGKTRWNIIKSSAAESGGNLGSSFAINRWDDSGAFINSPLIIRRDTGVVSLANGLEFSGLSSFSTVLDDYREGTWVPDLRFGGGNVGLVYAASSRVGVYTKIGNTVFWWSFIKLTAKGTSVGGAQIFGLPYTSLGGLYHAGSVGYVAQMTGITYPGAMVPTNNSIVGLYNGVGGVMADTNFTNITEMYCAGQYTTLG